MHTSGISTASLMGSARTGISRMQRDLTNLNTEVVTSRMADVGLGLGTRAAQSVSLSMSTAAR